MEWCQAMMRCTRGKFGLCVATALAAALICGAANRPAQEASGFDSPEAAVTALRAAAQAGDMPELRRIFGAVFQELVSGDDVQDKAALRRFAQRLSQTHRLDPADDGAMTLSIGRNGYPFPIPLVQQGDKWHFDTEAGKEEILNRRIGENELKTIAVCRAFVVAQREYAQVDRDGDDVLEYAQKIASTPGKRDGLFWETAGDEPPSPLGPLVAEARTEGYSRTSTQPSGTSRPYHGYIYKILARQGPHAPGGAFDYVINGNMVAGFALVAYPVEWDSSGIVTFLVSANGKVLQKDLGEKTIELASNMNAYDPDESWMPADKGQSQ